MTCQHDQSEANEDRDHAIAHEIEAWFAHSARPLPWRLRTSRTRRPGLARRDAWASLVSEVMLQQTQVNRVLERFEGFMARFPTPEAMARAEEDDVLAAWRGMGYYSRARRLHAAAQAITRDHVGVVPSALDELRSLPGIGRYTAGAIASMVFGQRTPLVDGNVQRVLMRIAGQELPLGSREADTWTWERAGSLVEAARDAGVFNEGLMELGATVCTPRSPRCDECPVAEDCLAKREGRQDELPLPKERAARKEVHHACLLVTDPGGRVLLERRSAAGLWARMFQPPTLESDQPAAAARVASRLDAELGEPELLSRFTHQTTHRTVRFAVWSAGVVDEPTADRLAFGDRVWATPEDVGPAGRLAMSNAHRRVLGWTSGEAGGWWG
jgi:A/G-specific adenine glycosylase